MTRLEVQNCYKNMRPANIWNFYILRARKFLSVENLQKLFFCMNTKYFIRIFKENGLAGIMEKFASNIPATSTTNPTVTSAQTKHRRSP